MSREAVRQALRQSPDGLTVAQIAKSLKVPASGLYYPLKSMSDVYIDRWTPCGRSRFRYAAVYVAVPIPEDAPKPD